MTPENFAAEAAPQRYEKPAVTVEIDLEVRAGSPAGLPDLFNPDLP